jgi:hypothetical protein
MASSNRSGPVEAGHRGPRGRSTAPRDRAAGRCGQGIAGGAVAEADAGLDVRRHRRMRNRANTSSPLPPSAVRVDRTPSAVRPRPGPGAGHFLVWDRTRRSTAPGSALPPPARITWPTRNPISRSSPATTAPLRRMVGEHLCHGPAMAVVGDLKESRPATSAVPSASTPSSTSLAAVLEAPPRPYLPAGHPAASMASDERSPPVRLRWAATSPVPSWRCCAGQLRRRWRPRTAPSAPATRMRHRLLDAHGHVSARRRGARAGDARWRSSQGGGSGAGRARRNGGSRSDSSLDRPARVRPAASSQCRVSWAMLPRVEQLGLPFDLMGEGAAGPQRVHVLPRPVPPAR